MVQNLGLRWYRPHGKQVFLGPVYYPFDESDIRPYNMAQMRQWLKDWIHHSQTREGNAVMLGDFNHSEGCRNYMMDNCVLRGRGITLDGELLQRNSTGMHLIPAWWE